MTQPTILHSLRRRANTRNVSFRISLRWPIHINTVDKTKLSCNTPHRRSIIVSLETYPLFPINHWDDKFFWLNEHFNWELGESTNSGKHFLPAETEIRHDFLVQGDGLLQWSSPATDRRQGRDITWSNSSLFCTSQY